MKKITTLSTAIKSTPTISVFSLVLLSLLYISFLKTPYASITLGDETILSVDKIFDGVEKTQVNFQKTVGSAANYIKGGEALNSDCISNFEIMSGGFGGFSFPNLSDILKGFKDKLCDYANNALNEGIEEINNSLSVPLNSVNTPVGPIKPIGGNNLIEINEEAPTVLRSSPRGVEILNRIKTPESSTQNNTPSGGGGKVREDIPKASLVDSVGDDGDDEKEISDDTTTLIYDN